jgi:hypothetical protein
MGGTRAGLTRIFARWSGMQEEVTEIFLASRWTDNSGSIHIDGRHRFQTTKKHIIPYAVYDELVVVHYGDVNDHQPSPDDSAMRVVTPL